jgi:D-cysteine desulfhydrase family pyridoxal phosphate-dependent enzyme
MMEVPTMVELERLNRVRLAHLPTPLEFAKRLSEHLGGPQIWIKRDDCTGLAFGGNKARKLEFFLGDALRQESDTLVTMGPVQSNHVRMTAAAACKLGLECHAVLVGEEQGHPTGNFFMDHLFGLHYTMITEPLDELPPGLVEEKIAETMDHVTRQGRRPYLVPPGGAGPLGEISYYVAMKELLSQAEERGVKIGAIVTPVGSQSTLSGLVLGKKLLGLPTKVIGISVNLEGTCERAGLPGVEDMIKEAARLIGAKVRVFPEDYELLYDYVGEGYGIPTEACLRAVQIMAQEEGILVDPTYTGKSLAGLMDLVSKGRFERHDVVVYLHTGGTPALLNRPELFRF